MVHHDRILLKGVEMNRKIITMLLPIIILLICVSCQAHDRPDWPKYVFDSIPIPPQARNLRYVFYADSYYVTYSVDACYPPNSVINSVAALMKQKGFERLLNDPLNPGQKLSVAITPMGMSYVSHPWQDYWRDVSGNIVYYNYQYEIGKLPIQSYVRELEKSCLLQGTVIFSPADVFRRDQEEMQRTLKK